MKFNDHFHDSVCFVTGNSNCADCTNVVFTAFADAILSCAIGLLGGKLNLNLVARPMTFGELVVNLHNKNGRADMIIGWHVSDGDDNQVTVIRLGKQPVGLLSRHVIDFGVVFGLVLVISKLGETKMGVLHLNTSQHDLARSQPFCPKSVN